MILDQRRREILDVLEERGFASLQELVVAVGASESTVRRDLDSLDGDGRIRRTRGGAVAISSASSEPRDTGEVLAAEPTEPTPHLMEKRAIGKAVARLLQPGETVLLDGGSTTLEVAKTLGSQPMQVVTNSLPVVNLLFGRPNIELLMLGGLLYPKTGVALGALTDAALEQFRVQTLILGCGGVRDAAIYNQNSLLVEAERRMLDAADRRILAADSSKFGHAELVPLCELERIDCLVTDDGLPDHWRSRITDAGVDLVLAAEGSSRK